MNKILAIFSFMLMASCYVAPAYAQDVYHFIDEEATQQEQCNFLKSAVENNIDGIVFVAPDGNVIIYTSKEIYEYNCVGV